MNATGLDGYNQSMTGQVSATVRSAAAKCAADTVPCVVFNAVKESPGGAKECLCKVTR